jgi:hypothetical protein
MALQTFLRACGLASTRDSWSLNRQTAQFNEDEDGFRHRGVEVSYTRRNVRLGTSYLPVSAVRGVDWESHKASSIPLPWPPRVKVTITTNSINHPKHEVAFRHFGARENAEQFALRLKTAIEKAGGASLS